MMCRWVGSVEKDIESHYVEQYKEI